MRLFKVDAADHLRQSGSSPPGDLMSAFLASQPKPASQLPALTRTLKTQSYDPPFEPTRFPGI